MVYLWYIVEKQTKKRNMKTTKLQTDVQSFVHTIQSETVTGERVKICVALKNRLLKELSPATVKSYLTSYRKALTGALGENKHLLKFLKIPKAKDEKIKSEYRKAIQKRTETNQLFVIQNPSELIDFARGLLQSESYLKVGLGLMLLTGRRTAEILKTAIFHKVPNKVFEVVFEGQTKKGDGENLPYKIPILAPAKEVLGALEWLRKEKDFANISINDINVKCGKALNDYSKLFKNWLGTDCTPHDLRKAFAAITYGQSGKNESFRGFAAKVLGHTENSELTTETYFKYTI